MWTFENECALTRQSWYYRVQVYRWHTICTKRGMMGCPFTDAESTLLSCVSNFRTLSLYIILYVYLFLMFILSAFSINYFFLQAAGWRGDIKLSSVEVRQSSVCIYTQSRLVLTEWYTHYYIIHNLMWRISRCTPGIVPRGGGLTLSQYIIYVCFSKLCYKKHVMMVPVT